jgi:ATP-dependent Clp protease protease subunit
MSRIIRVTDITMDAYSLFSQEMDEYEHDEDSDENIIVELSSHGGDAYAALAFASRIRLSGCEVRVVGMGLVASAAVLVLASGHVRVITAEAWVMVHEDSDKLKGSVTDVEREATHMRALEVQWDQLLEKYTKTPAAEWDKLHRQTTYLTAQQCLKLGLVDEVL